MFANFGHQTVHKARRGTLNELLQALWMHFGHLFSSVCSDIVQLYHEQGCQYVEDEVIAIDDNKTKHKKKRIRFTNSPGDAR